MSQSLKSLYEAAFKNTHDGCDESWTLEDSEVDLISEIMEARAVDATDSEALGDAVSEYLRVDTKTKRILIKGHVVWDGEAYFAEEADAVAYLNENGFACTSFNEAFEAAENGEMSDCYETDWYEHGYCNA